MSATLPGVDVTLTPIEARHAAQVGCERRLGVLFKGGRDRPTVKPESVWTIDIEGAGAELAFAKTMGWYWDGSVGVFHDQADVRHVHVRRHVLHDWNMAIRSYDKPGVYLLVTGMLPDYHVHGWAKYPQAPTYEAAYNPSAPSAKYIRQSDLRDISELAKP